MNPEIHIALTGHRPNKLGGWNIQTPEYFKLQSDLEMYIRYSLSNHQVVHCHSGLALGADTVWSKAILNMREIYLNRVVFHAEIPMLEQPSKWFNVHDVEFWNVQYNYADVRNIYGSLKGLDEKSRRGKAVQLLYERNTGMIGAADIVLAVYDGTKGGTHHAVESARKLGKEVIRIPPSNYFT